MSVIEELKKPKLDFDTLPQRLQKEIQKLCKHQWQRYCELGCEDFMRCGHNEIIVKCKKCGISIEELEAREGDG